MYNLKLTAEEKKILKYQLQENQKTIAKLIAYPSDLEHAGKDTMALKHFEKINNDILKKLF